MGKHKQWLLIFVTILVLGLNSVVFAEQNDTVTDKVVTEEISEMEIEEDNSVKKQRIIVEYNTESAGYNARGESSSIEVIEATPEEIAQLKGDSSIKTLETDAVIKKASVETNAWNLNAIQFDYASENGYKSNGVKIAIFDTGINSNYLSVSGGVSFVEGVSSYEDDNGHGTVVAGIINANLNNGMVVGMNQAAQLYSVKVLDSTGTGYYSSIISGIDWAIENDIDIICMSFEGSQNSILLSNAISKAYDSGILMIAASGNAGENAISYPARYGKVLSVGATNKENTRAAFSNYGDGLDVMAPGTEIPSLFNYNSMNVEYKGTSVSTAHVVGLAAMVMNQNSGMSNADIMNAICHGCVSQGNITEYGNGLINIQKTFENINSIDDYININDIPDFEPGKVDADPNVQLAAVHAGNNQWVLRGNSVSVRAKIYDTTTQTYQAKVYYYNGSSWTYKATIDERTITGETAGAILSVTWTVPTSYTPGQYQIRYIYSNNNSYADDYFNIYVYTNDSYENNNTIDTAYNLNRESASMSSGLTLYGKISYPSYNKFTYNGTAETITSITKDHDYYKIDVDAGETINIDLYNLPEDFDMKLYGPDGGLIDTSDTTSDEYITYYVDSIDGAGIYYIHVYGYGTNWSTSQYTLKVKLDKNYDEYEVHTSGGNDYNNNDLRYMATSLGSINDMKSIYATISVPTDVDWYSVYLPANTGENTTRIRLSSLEIDCDIELYDSNENRLDRSILAGTNSENIYYNIQTTGTYYIKVYSYDDAFSLDEYKLTVYYERLEVYFSSSQTSRYMYAEWKTGFSSDTRFDYYDIETEEDTGYKTSSTKKTEHKVTLSESSDVTPVTGYYGDATSKVTNGSITTTVVSDTVDFYTRDRYEPNNNINQAYYAGQTSTITATLWSPDTYEDEDEAEYNNYDEDWYNVNIPSAGRLRVRLTPPSGRDYYLAVYDEDSGYIYSLTSNDLTYVLDNGNYKFAVVCDDIADTSPIDTYTLKFTYTEFVYPVEELHFGGKGVYTATGNYSETFTDLVSYFNGEELAFTRTYNSKDSHNLHFGRGWSFGFEGSVKDLERKILNSDGSIETYTDSDTKAVRFGDGNTQLYGKQSNGSFVAVDSRNTLVKNSDNTYTLTTPDNVKYMYNTSGYLSSIVDRYGNAVSMTVDSSGKVTKITDKRGRIYDINYSNGKVSAITDVTSNRTVEYQYDSNGNLSAVVDSTGKITGYSYYTDSGKTNYLKQITDSYDVVVKEIDYYTNSNESLKISSLVDEFGTKYSYSYNDNSNTTTITEVTDNGAPRTVTQSYDSKKFITTSIDAEGGSEITEYHLVDGENKYGEISKVTDRYGNITQFERDNNGNVVKTTNPDGSYEEFGYDNKNNIIWSLDEEGTFIRFIYDASNTYLLNEAEYLSKIESGAVKPEFTDANKNLYKVTSFSYDDDSDVKGLITSYIDGNGHTTEYTYNLAFDMCGEVNPESSLLTQYEYNGLGLQSAVIYPSGNRVEYTYNNNGKLIEEQKILTEGNETTLIVYDLNGREIERRLPNHVANDVSGTVSEYYENGKLKRKTDAMGYTFSYTYDNYGNVITETLPNGAIYLYEYDNINRIVAVRLKETASNDAVLITETEYSSADGKLTVTTRNYTNTNNDYVTNVVVYDYDGEILSKSTDNIMLESYSYYGNRLPKTASDGNGNTTYYTYHNYDSDNGEFYDEAWVPVSAELYRYEKTVYDKAGNTIKTVTSPVAVELYEVATDELVINYFEYFSDNEIKQVSDNEGRKVVYYYDDNRNLNKQETYYSESGKNIVEMLNDHNGNVIATKTYVDSSYIGDTISDSNGSYVFAEKEYDKNGNLAKDILPNGHEIVYTYDYNDRLISTSQNGVNENDDEIVISTSNLYDFEGNIIQTTDANGNITKNVYDAIGNLVYVIAADNGVTFNAYDMYGRKTATVLPKNYTGSVSLANASIQEYSADINNLETMNRTEYTSDGLGRVITITEKYQDPVSGDNVAIQKSKSYDNNGNVLTETDGMGYVTTYTYNKMNMLVSKLDAEGAERELPYSINYEYDALGRVKAERHYAGREEEYTYNNANLITMVKSKKDGVFFVKEENVYDLTDNLLSQTDGNGNTTSYTYNALAYVQTCVTPTDDSIPSKTTTFYYDGLGNLIKTSDNTGVEDIYLYNNQNNVISITRRNSDGTQAITTTKKYDAAGNLRFETDGNENVKEMNYDVLNRLISESIIGTTYSKTLTYDLNGNRLSEMNGFGNTISFQYDPMNRMIKRLDANNAVIETLAYNANNVQITSKDALNNVTSFSYDKNNRLICTTDALNHTISQIYDDAGNVLKKIDGNGNAISYTYDELGNIKSSTQGNAETSETSTFVYDNNGNLLTHTNGNGHTTTYEYNANNLLSKKYDHGGLEDLSKTEVYMYDNDGNMIYKKNRNGESIQYSYDIHDREISIVAPGISVLRTYDNNGNVSSMTDMSGVTNYTYDGLNRVLSKNVSNIGTITYQYDLIEGLQNGYRSDIVIDPKGNINVNVFDKNGRLVQLKDSEGNVIATYEYNLNGSRNRVINADGSSEYYLYNFDNTLYSLTNKDSNGNIIDEYTYTYDSNKNQVSKDEIVNGTDIGTTNYTYDYANRLSQVEEPSGKITQYIYDKAGNRKTESVTMGNETVTTQYLYNEQERLISVTATTNDSQKTTEYYYDNNGNQFSSSVEWFETPGTSNSEFAISVLGESSDSNLGCINEYNALNQLVKTYIGDKVVEHVYNGDGLRVKKISDNKATRYLYNGENIILELDDNNNQVAQNVFGLNLVKRYVDSSDYTYMYNGHGDVSSLLENDAVVARYYYDAFGNIQTNNDEVDNPYRFAGYEYDKETKNYYLKSRFYDSSIGRFIQEDAYKGKVNDPLSLNLYTYCNNNPIIYVDYDGYAGKLIFFTHGLNSNAKEFEKTISNLRAKNPRRGYEYISIGIATAGRGNNEGAYYTGSDKEGIYYNDAYLNELEYNYGKDALKNPDAYLTDMVNILTGYDINLLVRTEFSKGNLSFKDQRNEFKDIVKQFGAHNADVVFVGHSMGGLASINYAIDYAKDNPKKNITVITVSTPYHPNAYASIASDHPKIAGFLQDVGPAHADLGGDTSAMSDLRKKWNNHTGNNIEIYAISVAKAGLAKTDRRDEIGDGIVDVQSQQAKDKDVNGKSGFGYNDVIVQDLITGSYKASWGIEAADTDHPYHHSNTPDLAEVANQIHNIIRGLD